MTSKEESPKLDFGRGVAAVLSYQGKIYGISTQSEDHNKFEVAVAAQEDGSNSMKYGYLKNSKIGFIGGGVEPTETLEEALKREIKLELAEVMDLAPEEISKNILSDLEWKEPIEVDNFSVFQAFQSTEEVAATPRGAFKVYLTTIKLSKTVFEKLESVLIEIDKDKIEQLRPFAASIVSNNKLSNFFTHSRRK